MEIPFRVRHSPRVRRMARWMLGSVVARRQVPNTPYMLRFPASQYLKFVLPGGIKASEPELAAQMTRWVAAGDVAVDIGANVGLYSLLLAHLVGEHGAVHCFEPDPQSSRWLLENIRRNDLGRATLWSVALSSAEGIADLHLDLNAARSTSLIAGWDVGVDPNRRQRMHIVTARLDGLGLGHVDFIKIDVEGAELNVLEGARETIVRSQPVMLIEVIDRKRLAEVRSLLETMAYVVADAKSGTDPRPDALYSGNLIALPRLAGM